MQIKIITYNIWDGTHLDRVIEFLKTEAADIICLQEVGTSGQGFAANKAVNSFEILRDSLGMKGEYQRLFWGDEGKGVYDLGVVIFSHFPIEQTVAFRYEKTENIDQVVKPMAIDRYYLPRVLLGVKLRLEAGDLWIFNTHHTITPEGGVTTHQLQETQKIKEYLKTYDKYILCGDMNTPYGNENYLKLSEGLVDLSEPSKPTLHPLIHKVGHKKLHIDYVFTKGPGIRGLGMKIPLVDGSDHLPVVVELEV